MAEPKAILGEHDMSAWQRWLHHPESLPVRRFTFHIHLWLGIVLGIYVLLMSLTGSVIVYRTQLERVNRSNTAVIGVVERVVDLHENLLFGMTGRRINGIVAIFVSLLSLTGGFLWWPGTEHWRRSLSVNWRSTFARINWDLHNALGFWLFLFIVMWGISGIYFCFPEAFNAVVYSLEGPEVPGKLLFGERVLAWMSNLHFGRFNLLTEGIWAALGLVPGVLSFTGVFMCCHRLWRRGAPLPK